MKALLINFLCIAMVNDGYCDGSFTYLVPVKKLIVPVRFSFIIGGIREKLNNLTFGLNYYSETVILTDPKGVIDTRLY